MLSGRELKIYNFDEGLFVMKLKQIMNQKMPYYGLHNQDHVVALSRDRMYVNMMNLQNGDCVATFKVNSPHVSHHPLQIKMCSKPLKTFCRSTPLHLAPSFFIALCLFTAVSA